VIFEVAVFSGLFDPFEPLLLELDYLATQGDSKGVVPKKDENGEEVPVCTYERTAFDMTALGKINLPRTRYLLSK